MRFTARGQKINSFFRAQIQIVSSPLFQVALSEASKSMHSFLDGKVHIATANIQVPDGWTAADCQTPLEPNKPVRSEVSGNFLLIFKEDQFPLLVLREDTFAEIEISKPVFCT